MFRFTVARTALAFALLVAACSSSDSSDVAGLEAELETANAEIAALESELFDATSTTTTKPATTTTAPTTSTTAPTTTTTKAVTIGVEDFEIELVIIENKCFNTAGASIQAKTELVVSDNGLNGSGEWLVIYEVAPVDGGSGTYNTEVDLDEGTFMSETLRLSVEDCDDVPVATVTSVLEN